jgi:trimeric autotransporter adhesin
MLQAASNNPSGVWKIILLLIVAGAAAILISPVSADTGVTLAAGGDRSYYQGEEVILSGTNYDSDSTYLSLVGPNLPADGGKLTSPFQNSISGDPGSFTVVRTTPDKKWVYTWYTGNPYVDAGSYTVYAASQPKTKDQLNGISSANVSIILKKPFIMAGISSSSISKGQPLTINGTAEGDPESVQIWILGNNYYSLAREPVNPDVSFRHEVFREVTSQFPAGQYFVIVQHSMQNNRFDIDVSGDYVRSVQMNNGTNLFRIAGPGSLQGRDAAGALAAALSDPLTGDDTYIEIPFQVTDAASSAPQATAVTTAPVQSPVQNPAQTALLPSALLGVFVLVLGIVVWKRH